MVVGQLSPPGQSRRIYSHLKQAMSPVRLVQAPFSAFGRAAFVLMGLLIVTFSGGLYRALPPRRAGTASVAMLTVHRGP